MIASRREVEVPDVDTDNEAEEEDDVKDVDSLLCVEVGAGVLSGTTNGMTADGVMAVDVGGRSVRRFQTRPFFSAISCSLCSIYPSG